jgi:hypothetical protein
MSTVSGGALNLMTGNDGTNWWSWGSDSSGNWNITPGTVFGSGGMVISPGGFTGIGTTAPAYRLDVAGQIRSSSGGIVFPDGSVQTTASSSLVTQSTSTLLGSSTQNTPTLFSDSRLYISTPGSVITMRGLTNTSWTYDIRNDQIDALTIQSEAPSSRPFAIDHLGNIGIGTTAPGADLAGLPIAPASGTPILEVNGDIALTQGQGGQIFFEDGTVQATAWTGVLGGGDYAESVDVTGSRTNYEPGDVQVVDKNVPSNFVKSSEPYSTMVAGIYSTKPGAVGRRKTTPKSADEIPMAIVGIVPAKVSAENGAIEAGDLLVSSSTPGVAMKGTDRSRMLGTIIGKAMGTLISGTSVIEVLVTLQ